MQNPEELSHVVAELRDSKELLYMAEGVKTICSSIKAVGKLEGDFAEVGVYRGGTAKIISMMKDEKRKLHLFDTWAGHPELKPEDNPGQSSQWKGKHVADLDEVKKKLKDYFGVYFYPGKFPDTAKEVESHDFAFVHLDCDLYEGTKGGLEFFYPRMKTGGIIVVHDYPHIIGVKKAVDEFFERRPDPVIQISWEQCLIVKTSSHERVN